MGVGINTSVCAGTLGARLHSRYNPQGEAARYLNSLNLKSGIECFILIEPGCGYLVSALRTQFADSKIIVLHIDKNFPPADDAVNFYTEENKNVQDFLETEVPKTDISNIQIIEWRPSLNYYKKDYVNLFSEAVNFIKRMDAEKRTVSAFGKKWIGNFFRNLANVKQIVLYKTIDAPVIITGSGPSLEKTLPVIRNLQNECLIIAASSSVMALARAGVRPDIIIATDGGSWALRHIYPFFRTARTKGGGAESGAIIAANLSAALPSQCADVPFLIMNDGSLWQSLVLHELAIPSVIVPQKGTVSASAVELAFLLSGGIEPQSSEPQVPIYLAGVDLSVSGIRTHARPYAFDHLLFDHASRFTPVYSQTFFRCRQMQGGGSLEIYSAWFKKQLEIWQKRIFSLGGEHEIFKSGTPVERQAKKTGGCFKNVSVDGGTASFRERGVSALLAALNDSRYASSLKAELTPMLFPREKEVTARELEKAIIGLV